MRQDKSKFDDLLKDADRNINWKEDRKEKLHQQIWNDIDYRKHRYHVWMKRLKYTTSAAVVVVFIIMCFNFLTSLPNNSFDESSDSGSPTADYDTAEEARDNSGDFDEDDEKEASGDDAANWESEEDADGEGSNEQPSEDTNNQVEQDTYVIVEQRIDDDLNAYEQVNEVVNDEMTGVVMDILNGLDWESAVVNMSRPADYRFYFHNEHSEEEMATIYELWITPSGAQLEVVKNPDQYVRLSTEQAATLFEVLTGEALQEN